MLVSHQDNTLCGAHNLGYLTGTKSLNNFVGQDDRADCYKFSLADERLLSISIGKLRSRVDVTLYDYKGKKIDSGAPSCINAEAIETTLEAGKYYLSIQRRKHDTNYRLLTEVSELGTLPTSAKLEDLGQLAVGNTAKSGAVSSSNLMDYYQFTLAQNANFTANVGNLSQPVQVSLYYDRNDNHLPDTDELFATVDSSNTVTASLTRLLPQGAYLVGITSLSNNSHSTEYTLTLTQHPQAGSLPTDPGEDSYQ
ncbi:MAG TPA: PPC domain-containing protein, partial [Allocoleopsis sp.]